jgi:hypothetical protein
LPTKTDTVWLSALRGRVLAVLGAGLSLWATAVPAWHALSHLFRDGPTGEHIQLAMTATATSLDAAQVLLVAGGSLVAVVAAGLSKVRSLNRVREEEKKYV